MAHFYVWVRDFLRLVGAHHDQPGQQEDQEVEQKCGQPHHACPGAVGRDTVAGSPESTVPQEGAAKVCYHELEVVFGEGWVLPWPQVWQPLLAGLMSAWWLVR